MDSLQLRFSRISENWFLLEPLFFIVLCTHTLISNKNIASMRSGKGLIEYNPDYIESITDKTLTELLKIEIIRILLKHPYQRQKPIRRISFLASNMTIWELYPNPFCYPTAQDLWQNPSFYNKNFEFYYQELYKHYYHPDNSISPNNNNPSDLPPKYDDGGNIEEDSLGDNSSSGDAQRDLIEDRKIMDENPETASSEGNSTKEDLSVGMKDETLKEAVLQKAFENSRLWEEDELLTEQINGQIEMAKNSFSWGTIPGKLKDEILASLIIRLDYRKVLNSFRAYIISERRCLTRMRPNRRYDFQYLGSRYQFTTKLLIAVDVSGSVSNEDLTNAFSVINRFFKYGIKIIDVMQFDTEIKGVPLPIKKVQKKIQLLGRGGTSFQCVIDYAAEHRNYDRLIIITDGCAPLPELTKGCSVRILWMFNNEDNYNSFHKQFKTIGKCGFFEKPKL